MEGVSGVSCVTDARKRVRMQRMCQDMCGWRRAGFPGTQPVSMEESNLALLAQKHYKVSWKADGVRYMMLIDGRDEVYMFDRDHNVFQVPNLRFPRRKERNRSIKETLLDGEMVIDKHSDRSMPRYLIYDIVQFEGRSIGKYDFKRRLTYIKEEIVEPRYAAISDGKIDKNKEPFSVRAKDFWDVGAVGKILAEKFRNQLGHEIDGLIFQPVENEYLPGRCDQVLKWKPAHLNSIDFKLRVEKGHERDPISELKGHLYVMESNREIKFDEIKLTGQLQEYDKKIIECSLDERKGWVFMRERTDKSFPNGYKTAKAVLKSIKNPISEKTLIDFIDSNPVKLQSREKRSDEYSHANGRTKRKRTRSTDGVSPKRKA